MRMSGLAVISVLFCGWYGLAAAGEQCSNIDKEAANPSTISSGPRDVNNRPRISVWMHTLRDILAAYEQLDSANRYVIEDGSGEWIARLCLAFSFFADSDKSLLSEVRLYGVSVRHRSDGVVVLSPEAGRMSGPLLPPRDPE